jgi:hypothetical protein
VNNRLSVQKRQYSGKEKRHTQKAQLIADQKTVQIVATAFANGSKHDFQLFKDDQLEFAEHIRIWQMRAIKDWQTFTKIVKRLSRNPSTIL